MLGSVPKGERRMSISPANLQHGILLFEQVATRGGSMGPKTVGKVLSSAREVIASDWPKMGDALAGDLTKLQSGTVPNSAIEHAKQAVVELRTIERGGAATWPSPVGYVEPRATTAPSKAASRTTTRPTATYRNPSRAPQPPTADVLTMDTIRSGAKARGLDANEFIEQLTLLKSQDGTLTYTDLVSRFDDAKALGLDTKTFVGALNWMKFTGTADYPTLLSRLHDARRVGYGPQDFVRALSRARQAGAADYASQLESISRRRY